MSNVYTQTNQTQNHIINFRRGMDGRLMEVQRVSTGGKGTNGYVPLTGEESGPDSLISSNAVIVSRVGTHYVIEMAPWNGTIAPGGEISFGFQASGTGRTPTNIKLNGVAV